MDGSKKWYAVYTRAGYERKVTENLARKNIEHYLPSAEPLCKNNDRKTKWHQPLFKSFVFVRMHASQLPALKKVAGIINLVYWLDKPAVVDDAEVEIIKKVLEACTTIKLERASREPVVKHPVRLSSISNSIKIMLPSLGYILTAETTPINEKAFVWNTPDQVDLSYAAYAVINTSVN